MNVEIHSHAKSRLIERGANETEIIETVEHGEKFPAKPGRVIFKKVFDYYDLWNGQKYNFKQLEVVCVEEENKIVVVTVMVKYFQEVRK
ncbi:MAG TPA: DUF4258 domain-containing protein [Candidatus Wallbacteria bacterium]|nr:DUF4258 domain-containing protein [Candidatus Wallbacteria bacterium]